MIVYEINPIDCWSGWQTVEEFLKESAGPDYFPMECLYEILGEAMKIARTQLHWEGDVREGPYVCGLPTNESGCPEILIAWKQDNNGTTYIATPFAMPWLEDSSTDMARTAA